MQMITQKVVQITQRAYHEYLVGEKWNMVGTDITQYSTCLACVLLERMGKLIKKLMNK